MLVVGVGGVISAALGKRCSSTQKFFISVRFMTRLKSCLSCQGLTACMLWVSGEWQAGHSFVDPFWGPEALPALPRRTRTAGRPSKVGRSAASPPVVPLARPLPVPGRGLAEREVPPDPKTGPQTSELLATPPTPTTSMQSVSPWQLKHDFKRVMKRTEIKNFCVLEHLFPRAADIT